MLRKIIIIAALIAPTAAHAEWQVASSNHFVVYSDDAPQRVKALTTRLETFDRALRRLRQVPDNRRGPATRVTVFVVDTISDVRRLYPGGSGANVGGFYSSRSTGPVAFVPRRSGDGGSTDIGAEEILLHEYSHHFMYSDWPSAIWPMWFSEGFAEFNSTAMFKSDGSVVFGAPPRSRTYGVTLDNQMPAKLLLRPSPGKMSDLQTYALYSRGWLLTHYLTLDPERRRQLAAYVQAINAGKPADEASQVFGDLDALDRKMNSYVRRPSFQSIQIPASDLDVGEVTVRALSAGEAALMPVRLESEATVTDKEAKVVAANARRLAASFPNDAGAQNALAEAEYDAGNYAAAATAADRAITADPKSVHAVLYKGMALEAMERKTPTGAAAWQSIRKWYTTANRIDPENPQPLILYYQSFAAAKQPATANAEKGLLYAAALAPFDFSVRMQAARIYLQQGKVEDARKQMLPVAYSPHSGKSGDMLRAVITTLDSDGAPAALTLLNKGLKDEEAERGKRGGKEI